MENHVPQPGWVARKFGSNASAILGLGGGVTRIAGAAAMIQAATLTTNVLIANATGATGFGLYAFMLSSINAGVLLIQASLGLMANRYLAELRVQRSAQTGAVISAGSWLSLGAGVLAAAAMAGYAWHQGALPGSEAQFAAAVTAVAVTIPLASVSQFQSSALAGLEDWRSIIRLSAVQATATIALPIAGAYVDGAVGACWGIAGVNLLRCAVGATILGAGAKSTQLKSESREPGLIPAMLRRFALPAFFAGLTFSGTQWFGVVFLLAQSEGARQLGLYAAAYTLRTAVVFLPSHIGTVSLSMMTRHNASGDQAGHSRVHVTSTVMAGAVAALIAGAIALAAPILLPLFGKEFAQARLLVNVMMIASVLESIATASYQLLPSRSRMWTSFAFVALPRDILFLLTVLLTVPFLDELGLAFAQIAGQSAVLIGIAVTTRLTSGQRSA